MKSPWYAGRGEQYATGIGTSVTGAVSGLWRYENAGAEYGVPRPKATLPPVSDGGMPFITQGVLHVIDATGVLAGKPSCRLEGPVGGGVHHGADGGGQQDPQQDAGAEPVRQFIQCSSPFPMRFSGWWDACSPAPACAAAYRCGP